MCRVVRRELGNRGNWRGVVWTWIVGVVRVSPRGEISLVFRQLEQELDLRWTVSLQIGHLRLAVAKVSRLTC